MLHTIIRLKHLPSVNVMSMQTGIGSRSPGNAGKGDSGDTLSLAAYIAPPTHTHTTTTTTTTTTTSRDYQNTREACYHYTRAKKDSY